MEILIYPILLLLFGAGWAWVAFVGMLQENLVNSGASGGDKVEELFGRIMERLPMLLRPFFLLTYPIWMLVNLLFMLTPVYLIFALYLIGPAVCVILAMRAANWAFG